MRSRGGWVLKGAVATAADLACRPTTRSLGNIGGSACSKEKKKKTGKKKCDGRGTVLQINGHLAGVSLQHLNHD
eukprot:m.267611 g.267611  ORF g.267611 m.267611 type:complete len:74 (-) comp22804_c7_seq3:3346-3567(-)